MHTPDATPRPPSASDSSNADAAAEVIRTGSLAPRMLDAVKGKGFIGKGVKPLTDDDEIFNAAYKAEKALRSSVKNSMISVPNVVKGLNPSFTQEFGLFLQGGPQQMGWSNWTQDLQRILSAELGKNITLTSPLASGIVPFDLLAPSRLIYPVYTPLRNKLPRVAGQGSSRRAKVLSGIQGTQTPSGSNNPARITIAEVPQSQSLNANWPLSLPPAGAQTAVDLNIPYKFMGMTEALSWLAQFAGQGFEDISALVNLILLQEMMLGEEYQIIGGTNTALVAPTITSATVRTAGSNETGVSGMTTAVYFRLTAKNYYGETVQSAMVSAAPTGTQVVDIVITPVRGALNYNLYASTGASEPVIGSRFFVATIGGSKYTFQGAVPTSGANPPATDSGTSSTNDYEGLLSILSGHASTDAAVYPSGFQASYINQSVGSRLNTTVAFNALKAMWDGAGAFRANPAELIVEGVDATNFANSVLLASGQVGAYQFFIHQNEVGNITAGAAISQFQNPITRDMVRILVHPWLTQGTAFFLSYSLPQAWTNIANVFEMTLVQDYLSVAWPVIDPSFRYSMFMYGALVAFSPQYCGYLGGLQVSDTTPYS